MKTERLTSSQVATIAASGSQSDAVDLGGATELAVLMPAGWDAAALTVLGCDTAGGTFLPVKDDAGTEVSLTAAASTCIVIGTVTKRLGPLRFIKLRSGTAATPVTQTAERVITLVTK